jgi:hypothetical protein
MSMDIERLIEQANGRLKRGRIGLSIEQRGNRLWFRGTLPPKPPKVGQPYQQRFAADLPMNPVGIQHAERKAKLMGAKLALGEFDWADWSVAVVKLDSCGVWIAKQEVDYWATHRRTPSAQNNWRKIYQLLKKLPPDSPLTLEVLLQVVLSTSADTQTRQRICILFAALAKKAGIDPSALMALSGHYSPAMVEPRLLPTDAEIQAWRDKINHPGWRYLFGLQAVYGLRNHELFHVNLDEFPTLWVEDPVKTGKRFVYPVFPEWAVLWRLDEVHLPNLAELKQSDCFAWNNEVLGAKVTKYFSKRGIPFTPYALRHAFARRCFETSILPDLAAKLMGHSMAIHLRIYRAWIDEGTYRKAYEAAMARRSTTTLQDGN